MGKWVNQQECSQKMECISVLKAEVTGVDCTTVTPCVEHARCDRDTGRCLCDKDYSVRWDGLCGECMMLGILSLFC